MKTKLQIALFFIFLTSLSAFAQTDYALEFNGVDQKFEYASDVTLDNLNGATDYTIEVWVKPLSTTIHGLVVLKRWNQFALTLYKNDTKRFYFTHYGNKNTYVNTIDNVINLNEWNHLVVVCSTATNSIKLYANGVDVTLAEQVALPLNPLAAEEDAAAAIFNVGYGGNGTHLNANIDKVRIKKTALNIADLQINVTDADYTSDEDTIMLLNFKEGTGVTTLNEASGINGDLACITADCTELPNWVALSKTLALDKLNTTTFNVFPNPTIDKTFIIQTNNSEMILSIEVISVLGKLVKKIDYKEKNNKVKVDVPSLKHGIYFIRTLTNKGIGVQKIMVK
jgi:hypothetical protein